MKYSLESLWHPFMVDSIKLSLNPLKKEKWSKINNKVTENALKN